MREKRPKKPQPGERKQGVFWYRPRQRTGFCGALRFNSHRAPQESVRLILHFCLKAKYNKEVLCPDDIPRFCRNQGITVAAFETMWSNWLVDLDLGTQVFELLQLAGYQGNIDDLWRSVYNIVKPTRPTAGVKTKTTRRFRKSKGLFITSQTPVRRESRGHIKSETLKVTA